MSQELKWVNQQGTIANFLIGVPSTVILQVIDNPVSLVNSGVRAKTVAVSQTTTSNTLTFSNNTLIYPNDYVFGNNIAIDTRVSSIQANNITISSPTLNAISAGDQIYFNAVTYLLTSGSLPPGLALNSNTGIISGTPTYSNPNNNYFVSETYSFTVTAQTSDLRAITGSFNIIISNTVNQDFTWITPAGDLGTIPNGTFYKLQLQAQSSNNLGIQYSFISGELPDGMQLVSSRTTKTTSVTNQFISANLTLNNVQGISSGDYVYGTGIAVGTTVNYVDIFYKRVVLNSPTTIEMPSGTRIDFYSPGYLQGIPTLLNTIAVNTSQKFRFSIRATNSLGHIHDRSFFLEVTNVYGPIIEPTTTFLGSYFDGSFFSQQLIVNELNPNVTIKWSNIGNLPPGITLNSHGLLSGYLQPLPPTSANQIAGYDKDEIDPITGAILYQQQYDRNSYDFTTISTNALKYNFTVQAFDGANYDLQDYVIDVVSRQGYTADSANVTADNTFLTVDNNNVYLPVLLNASTTLPTARQDSYYAYKFEGFDFSGDTLTYSITTVAGAFDSDGFDPLDQDPNNNGLLGSFDHLGSAGSNLPGVVLDAQSGWLYGKVSPQTSSIKYYSFGITVSKVRNSVLYNSKSVRFTLPVLGDVNNLIEWISDSDLGSIDNGTVSELSVEATSRVGKVLKYEIYDIPGLSARLPQGLRLLSTGEISGRVSFEAFTIDNYTTTFDNETLTIDRISRFTVRAYAEDGTAESLREFSIKLNIIDQRPYVNLYLKALPAFDQRQIYTSVVNNVEIFDPDLIYRPNDPWFGVHQDIQMLFLPGLTSKQLDEYEQAIIRNHWTKKYNFGEIKTAVVFDESYNKKYEVVYIEVLDPQETKIDGQFVGPAIELDLTDVIANPYIDANGNQYKIVYPNSSDAMIQRLEQNVGYVDQSSLPPWMTSNQPAPVGSEATFNPPLGFVKAVVLAYTIPGASKLIAYRLKTAGINFTNIDFTVDRYEVDNFYSKYFDTDNQIYFESVETTFDALPKNNVGAIVSKVNYGVSVPFREINGRTIDYINSAGGIDGVPVTAFSAGKTLIFAKQEGFLNAGPYQGWVYYKDAYIGDNITTVPIEGYDSESYDTYNIVQGYYEKQIGTATKNDRGSIWTIQLVGNIVILIPTLEIALFDRVQITNGKTYGGAVMYYTSPDQAGQTVPYYTVYQIGLNAITTPTTFNGGTTKFFSQRDQYYVPNSQDKYLKFPQTGVFN